MEQEDRITDATLSALRKWAEFPQNPTCLEEVEMFRNSFRQLMGQDIYLNHFEFHA